MNVIIEANGSKFYATPKQAMALATLLETQKGGFARANGYVSKSGRITPEVSNLTFLSRFNLERLYQRKIAALESIKFDDVEADLRKVPKLKNVDRLELREAFHDRVRDEILSMEKTLAGVREDARRQSHDRNYVSLGAGVKVHFVTEKDSRDGLTYPVLTNGLPTAKNIMVSAMEISRTVTSPGAYKPVNSGVPKLISNVLNAKLPKATKIKTLSLDSDNFESLVIDGNTILPKDIADAIEGD